MAFGVSSEDGFPVFEHGGGYVPEVLPSFAVDDSLTGRVAIEI
jgi:hypothetical protein